MKKTHIITCVIALLLLQLNLYAQKETMMKEKNISIATQFYNEVINKGDTGVMNSIVSDNFIDHNAPPNSPKGVEGFKQFLTMVGTAFPDIQVKIEELLADSDKVVARLTINGTQTGVLMGNIPPSGKHAVWTGIDILKIEYGIITERWSQRDIYGMMKQIGAVK